MAEFCAQFCFKEKAQDMSADFSGTDIMWEPFRLKTAVDASAHPPIESESKFHPFLGTSKEVLSYLDFHLPSFTEKEKWQPVHRENLFTDTTQGGCNYSTTNKTVLPGSRAIHMQTSPQAEVPEC